MLVQIHYQRGNEPLGPSTWVAQADITNDGEFSVWRNGVFDRHPIQAGQRTVYLKEGAKGFVYAAQPQP